MKGRQVALLLTGVLPMLTKTDVIHLNNEANESIDEHDYHDVVVEAAAEPIHNDVLQQLPSLPLHLLVAAIIDNPGNSVMTIDPVFDTDTMENVMLQDWTFDKPENEAQEQSSKGPAIHDNDTEPKPPEGEEIQENRETDRSEEEEYVPATAVGRDDAKAGEIMASDSATKTDDPSNSTEESESPKVVDGDAPVAFSHEVAEGKGDQKQGDDEDEEGSLERVLVDYASKSAGALILEKSPAMKGTSNLLNADNDKYAIAPCVEKKYVVIGLSEDILVKQVKLANYERYSSHLKDFQILGSQTMGDWVDLGTYTAKPGNGEHSFELNEPSWARYLKFRFLTHYGSEHYCTYSQIKVHGSTMLQGFHEQWEDSQEILEEENENVTEERGTTKSSETAPVEATAGANDETPMDDAGDASKLNDNVADTHDSGDSSDAASKSRHMDDAAGDPDDTASEVIGESSVQHATAPSDDSGNVGETTTMDSSADPAAGPEVKSRPDDGSAQGHAPEDEVDVALAGCQISDEPSPSTLLSASVPISSHYAVNAERSGSIENLGTAAIKPNEKGAQASVSSTLRAMVTEASEAILTSKDATVADIVRELQQRLKTTIKIINPDKGDTMDQPGDDSTAAESIDEQQEIVETTDDAVAENRSLNDDLGADESVVVVAEALLETNASDPDVAEAKSSQESAAPTEHATVAQVQIDVDNDSAVKKGTGIESNGAGVKATVLDSELVDNVRKRFPSAWCMDDLDFNAFKAKIIAARKGGPHAGGSSSSGQAGSPGKMEPIFKTLTDEIKTLQISNSVQEQYIKSVTSCYQRVILEMAETLKDIDSRQEKRLSDLEKAMDAMQPNTWATIIVSWTKVASFMILAAGFLHTVFGELAMHLIALDVMGKNLSLLIVGAVVLSLVMVALRFKVRFSRKQRPRPGPMSTPANTQDSDKRVATSTTETKGEGAKAHHQAVTASKQATVTTETKREYVVRVCRQVATTEPVLAVVSGYEKEADRLIPTKPVTTKTDPAMSVEPDLIPVE